MTCLVTSLDDTLLVSGSKDASVKIWDICSLQCVRTLTHKGELVLCLVCNVVVLPVRPQKDAQVRMSRFNKIAIQAQGSKLVVANATMFSHLLPVCSCGSKHLLLP